MGFARTVFWISVIALAAQGLARNGRQLQRLYDDSKMLAQNQRMSSARKEESTIHPVELTSYTSADFERSLEGSPDGKAAVPPREAGEFVEEIIELRKQMGRPSVADVLNAVKLPGDGETGPGNEGARVREQEELFRKALRQMPGIPPGSGESRPQEIRLLKPDDRDAGSCSFPAIKAALDWVREHLLSDRGEESGEESGRNSTSPAVR